MLDTLWTLLDTRLFPEPSTAERFNPYRDRHEDIDRPEAPHIRRANLRNYLRCFAEPPPLVLLAEAPGPWGCRFSGVPITSEAQLVDDSFPISGSPSSRREAPHTEYSASIFWRVLQPYFPHFFVWNSVPLHPHDANEPLSIRTPRRSEVAQYEDLLADLLEALRPDRIVAIGRKAERALQEIEVDGTYVRHPSQGGAKKFETGVLDVIDAMDLPAATSA